jgi:hypothetical protein
MALAATLVPAWRAGRRPPLEAMLPRRSVPEQQAFRPGWVHYFGLAALLLFAVMATGSVRGWWPAEWSTTLIPPGMAVFLVGCVLSLPLVVSPLTGWCCVHCSALRRRWRCGSSSASTRAPP